MKQKIFAFSGLGADKRAFSKLDISDMDITYVEWLKPLHTDTIESYALRLADTYNIPRQGAVAIGISFGGMCVSELARFYDFDKIILISSAKTRSELPNLYKLTAPFGLHKLMPDTSFSKPNKMLNWMFGVEHEEDRALLSDILRDTDTSFSKWAVGQISLWNNTYIPPNCLHIHGSKDRIIPIHNVDYSIKIQNGGHFMVVNKAAEISFHIRNYLM